MNVQKRPRSSIRARRTACFSVSSSSRYMSLTSCRALSSWGCRSPFPGGVGRRGRAGDAGLARWIRGSGPVAVSLAMGLGTVVGVRGPGRAVGTPGLVEGLVPRAGKEDRQTCTQERHQSCKATLNLGQADSPGQSQGRPWHSHAQESPVETFTAAGTPLPALSLLHGTASRPTGWCPLASRETEAMWKQDKVERGAQASGQLGLGPGGRRGASQCAPHSAQGARLKDSNSNTEKQ